MKQKFFISFRLLLVSTTSVFFLTSAKKCNGLGGLGFADNCDTPERWNSLRATYNLTTVWSLGLSHWVDKNVPGRVNTTITVLPNSTCINRVGSATYFGHRVNQDADNSIVGLYDNNGIVAGIQVRIRQEDVLVPNNSYKFAEIPLFQNETYHGKRYFVLTAYFVDPDIICKDGRTPDEFVRLQGTGNILYFQNGRTPSDLFLAPMNKEDASAAGFTDNECYPGMGYHNFFNTSIWAEDNCESYNPIFLLYNDCGHLIGFGFLWTGHSISTRFEHPSAFGISAIIGTEETPQCLLDAVNTEAGGSGLSSLHVWFVDRNPGCTLTSLVSHVSRAVSKYYG